MTSNTQISAGFTAVDPNALFAIEGGILPGDCCIPWVNILSKMVEGGLPILISMITHST